MKTALFFLAICAAGCLICSCSHLQYGNMGTQTALGPDEMTPGAIGPSSVGGEVNFGTPGLIEMDLQTGTGIVGSTEYTLFGGRVGGFPSGRGFTFNVGSPVS